MSFYSCTSELSGEDNLQINGGHNLVFVQYQSQSATGYDVKISSAESVHFIDPRFEGSVAGGMSVAAGESDYVSSLIIDRVRSQESMHFGNIGDLYLSGRWLGEKVFISRGVGNLKMKTTNIVNETDRQKFDDTPSQYYFTGLQRTDHTPAMPIYTFDIEATDWSTYAARTGDGIEAIDDNIDIYFKGSAITNNSRSDYTPSGEEGALHRNKSAKLFMNVADYTDDAHVVYIIFKNDLANHLCAGNYLSFLLPIFFNTAVSSCTISLRVHYTAGVDGSKSMLLVQLAKTLATASTDPRGFWHTIPFLADLARVKPVDGGVNEDGYTWSAWEKVTLLLRWHAGGDGIPTSSNFMLLDSIPFFEGKFPPTPTAREERKFIESVNTLEVSGENTLRINVGGTMYKPASVGGGGELILTPV